MLFSSNVIKNEIKERIKEVEKENDVKLSTTQKIVLSTNGPLSSILTALFGEVHLFTLKQRFEKADKDVAEKVEVEEGEEVHHREIIVHKHGLHNTEVTVSDEFIKILAENALI